MLDFMTYLCLVGGVALIGYDLIKEDCYRSDYEQISLRTCME